MNGCKRAQNYGNFIRNSSFHGEKSPFITISSHAPVFFRESDGWNTGAMASGMPIFAQNQVP
jgi:hypothetical protein